MTRRKLAALAGWLASAILQVQSQMYNIYMEDDGVGVPYLETPEGLRFLQLQTGNRPDVNASSSSCYVVGAKFQCEFSMQFMATDKSYTNVDFQVMCDLNSQLAFDFRRATGCTCGASLTYSNTSIPKTFCPCVVCPDSFGQSPISLDCSGNASNASSYVINTCSSLDCSFSCNGNCTYGCQFPNTNRTCDFCSPNTTPSPTKWPVGNLNATATPATSPAVNSNTASSPTKSPVGGSGTNRTPTVEEPDIILTPTKSPVAKSNASTTKSPVAKSNVTTKAPVAKSNATTKAPVAKSNATKSSSVSRSNSRVPILVALSGFAFLNLWCMV